MQINTSFIFHKLHESYDLPGATQCEITRQSLDSLVTDGEETPISFIAEIKNEDNTRHYFDGITLFDHLHHSYTNPLTGNPPKRIRSFIPSTVRETYNPSTQVRSIKRVYVLSSEVKNSVDLVNALTSTLQHAPLQHATSRDRQALLSLQGKVDYMRSALGHNKLDKAGMLTGAIIRELANESPDDCNDTALCTTIFHTADALAPHGLVRATNNQELHAKHLYKLLIRNIQVSDEASPDQSAKLDLVAKCHKRLASIYLEKDTKEDFVKAVEHLRSLVRKKPRDTQAVLQFATMLAEGGNEIPPQFKEGIEALKANYALTKNAEVKKYLIALTITKSTLKLINTLEEAQNHIQEHLNYEPNQQDFRQASKGISRLEEGINDIFYNDSYYQQEAVQGEQREMDSVEPINVVHSSNFANTRSSDLHTIHTLHSGRLSASEVRSTPASNPPAEVPGSIHESSMNQGLKGSVGRICQKAASFFTTLIGRLRGNTRHEGNEN